jgi:long-chain acyl-CoA synthetase
MLGYWNNESATRETIDPEGWLHTGDQVKLDDDGRVTITGRLKEIIVLANGEKVPPSDMEMAISLDPLVEQVMIIGEGRPYLAALLVLNPALLDQEGRRLGMDLKAPRALHDKRLIDALLRRISERLETFPGYAQLRRVAVIAEPWSIENDMMTPTMKLKRARILERYRPQVEELYAGH